MTTEEMVELCALIGERDALLARVEELTRVEEPTTPPNRNVSLGTLLTQLLQDRGILPDDYHTLSTAVFDSLSAIDKQVRAGEYLQFPNGQPYFKR